jgi:hypothetical protein
MSDFDAVRGPEGRRGEAEDFSPLPGGCRPPSMTPSGGGRSEPEAVGTMIDA